jgi:hypothetical protein
MGAGDLCVGQKSAMAFSGLFIGVFEQLCTTRRNYSALAYFSGTRRIHFSNISLAIKNKSVGGTSGSRPDCGIFRSQTVI